MNNQPRSSTETIIGALRVLANDIQSDDGIANACCYEASCRLEELQSELSELRKAGEPRPMSEAPRDGTKIIARSFGVWYHIFWNEVIMGGCWQRCDEEDIVMNPLFFDYWLQLAPVKE